MTRRAGNRLLVGKSTTIPSIVMPTKVLETIVEHCRSDPHREVCGLVFGKEGYELERAVPIPPIERHMASFEMDPFALADALKEAGERDEILLANFHSHPSMSAIPSFIDVAASKVWEDSMLWLIYGHTWHGVWQQVEELRAWHIQSTGFDGPATKVPTEEVEILYEERFVVI